MCEEKKEREINACKSKEEKCCVAPAAAAAVFACPFSTTFLLFVLLCLVIAFIYWHA